MATHPLPIRWTETGDPSATDSCVLLHGFTQTGACWPDIAIDRTRVGTVDLPGHGDASAVTAGPWEVADLLAASVDRSTTWIGYSMGARLALHLALARPDLVARLVLVSGTAGLADAAERSARRASDEALARRIESIGVDSFLAEWLALPLFDAIPPERSCLEARRTNTAAGLASSLRLCGTGAQEPLWDRLGELAGVEVVVITGADDHKFTALGDRLATGIGPSARRVTLPGCGHSPQLEDPERFVSALGAALGR